MADAQTMGGATSSSLAKAPYKEQDVHVVSQLIESLEKSSKDKGKASLARKTRFTVQGAQGGNWLVDSWKFKDWDYKRHDLPTYARGLFTTRSEYGQPAIAVRGYDKFFNVNEVRETQWETIFERTQGPYELTLKENGCIIFISGLPDDTLLVCSKHSTGERSDVEKSHASAGEAFLVAQLERLGKTRVDLARELYARNATAVAELCDDAFEEHILAYGPDKAGLYLHGINLNLPEFVTYPSAHVQDFAARWGFRQVGLITMDSIAEVRKFLEDAAATGAHDGHDVEGFVVRCRMSPNPPSQPYGDWFFKFKFEEPYLMYRQWRECTKDLIAGRTPQIKKHRAITEEYLLYARKRLAADPKLGKLYSRNHGIIQLRDDFLAFKNLNGADAANFEALYGGGLQSDIKSDVILVPIATLGCGKTTIAVALADLFGFGHVQNDNITGSRRPPRFTRQVLDELASHPAVVADRNNAQRHERKQLLTDVRMMHLRAQLVALDFVHKDVAATRQITQQRVFSRGDNHQTIHAASEGSKVVGIMDGFLSRFQPCDPSRAPDDGFDAVIQLDPTAPSRANLETVVRELHRLYPKLIPEMPSSEAMDAAVERAIGNYAPTFKHTLPDRSNNGQPRRGAGDQPQAKSKAVAKKKPLEYVAVHVNAGDIQKQLDQTFQGLRANKRRFYDQLLKMRRVQTSFHVTLMHRASAKQNPALWDRYVRLHTEAQAAAEAAEASGESSPAGSAQPALGQADVELERVVFDGRLMALVVRLVDTAQADGSTEEGWPCINRVSHITVGTRDDGVKPKESNDMLGRWLDEGSTDENGITDIVIDGRPVVPGTVRGVLSR